METSKRMTKTMGAGDAAVEGLMFGILSGVVMAVFVVIVELASGRAPLTVLGHFDAGGQQSPFIGAFTHIAVSGIYGVVFGVLLLALTRGFGPRLNPAMWLVLGLLYGALIFGVAEGVVLPRTLSALRELPVWVLGGAHLLYGASLAWLMERNK